MFFLTDQAYDRIAAEVECFSGIIYRISDTASSLKAQSFMTFDISVWVLILSEDKWKRNHLGDAEKKKNGWKWKEWRLYAKIKRKKDKSNDSCVEEGNRSSWNENILFACREICCCNHILQAINPNLKKKKMQFWFL